MSTISIERCIALIPAPGYRVWYWQSNEQGVVEAFSQLVAAWGSCQVNEAGEHYHQVLALVPDESGGLSAAAEASNYLGITHDADEQGAESLQRDAEAAHKREQQLRAARS